MSVPKNKRSESEVAFYTETRRIQIELIKFILKDFGATHSFRDLKTFTSKAKMTEEDKEVFKSMCEKYHIDVEAVYPDYILDYFRSHLLNDAGEAINNVVDAYSLYPNSLYEFNIRRQMQSDAIASFCRIKYTLSTIIELFHNVNMEKYVPLVTKIDREIERLKDWRKDCNKLRKVCIMNDERVKLEAEKERGKLIQQATAPIGDNDFLSRILNVRSISRNEIYKNTIEYIHSEPEKNQDGTLKALKNPVACVMYYDPNGVVINVGIGGNFKSFDAKLDAQSSLTFKPSVENSK